MKCEGICIVLASWSATVSMLLWSYVQKRWGRTSEIVYSRGYHDLSTPPHLTPSLRGQLNISMVVVTINSSNTITNSFNPKQCEIDVLDCWHFADSSNSIFLCQPLVHHLFSDFSFGVNFHGEFYCTCFMKCICIGLVWEFSKFFCR